MKKQKEKKVGDIVTAIINTQSSKIVVVQGKPKQIRRKIKVTGKIKKIYNQYGHKTYTITDGVVDDFTTRTIK